MPPRFLHVGCGPSRKAQTLVGFVRDDWEEVRFDIDAAVDPDIVGTMLDMVGVPSASMEAVFSSHNIEHLYPHEVSTALTEFRRVLKPGGFLVLTCPDLKSVATLIAEDKLTEPAYVTPGGPITPLDILYGHVPALKQGNLFMAHRCGFTPKTLGVALAQAGFGTVGLASNPAPFFDIWAIATPEADQGTRLQKLVAEGYLRAATPPPQSV